MKISVIGSGYVGLVTGTILADRGNDVVCVDKNKKVIDELNSGKVHIFEPGLEELVKKNRDLDNLSFTNDIYEAVPDADLILLAVGTPSNSDGSFNLNYIKGAARDIGKALKDSSDFKVVVGKSTVPQGTHRILSNIINQELGGQAKEGWAYVANPETLAEGTAVSDFSKPDRVLIGTDSKEAFAIVKELYHPFNIRSGRFMGGSPADAELAKLFSNTVLAARIAMINEFARIADVTPGADMDIIRRMVCEDSRIGYDFMFPSPGYGGSCFPKDVQGLVCQAERDGYTPLLLSQVHRSNEAHKNYIGERIGNLLKEKAKPRIAVWGLTFKPNTDDMRDAASVPIITGLVNRGAEIIAYEPKDGKAREIFGERITFVSDRYKAVEGADALVLLTEWREFDAPNFKQLKEIMEGNKLFDLRNRWLPEAANRNGFEYFGIGRNYPLDSKV